MKRWQTNMNTLKTLNLLVRDKRELLQEHLQFTQDLQKAYNSLVALQSC